MIETHAHLYDEAFDSDRDLVIQRAREAGVAKIILPNVDSDSLPRMLALEAAYPGYCHAAIGLHPTSVNANSAEELKIVRNELERRSYLAVGEIGIDLYWDKTYLKEQIQAFQQQLHWALEYSLPVIIHVRESLHETLEALLPFRGKPLSGVFHSFTGTSAEAEKIMGSGDFMLGINGIVSFKNAGLRESVKHIPLDRIVLETDAPYLTPAPFRGKRNESAYLKLIAEKLAEVYGCSKEVLIEQTTLNALKLFKLAP